MAARGDKRESILDAAIRVFARQGFHQSRVADIAREAGVADGTIYIYFKHKEDILIAIFEEKMALVLQKLRAELADVLDPAERLRTFISYHLTQVMQNRELSEILQVELRLSNKFMKEYVPVRLTEYLDVIAEIIVEGQRQGKFRTDISPAVMKRAIFGALDELAMHWVLTRGRRPDLQASAAQLAAVFLSGISCGGDSKPSAVHPISSMSLDETSTVPSTTGGQT
ncbi:MAG: TetR/AcrR family transcriptional regulator [Myxococcota bacterium]